MKTLTPREGKSWPGYILGGRIRTSTLVLIIAFLGAGWLYETYEPGPSAPQQIPATEVVPPGFIPDPDYTWAPRSDVQRHAPTTTTSTTPTSTSTAPASPGESTTPPTAGEPTVSPSPAPGGSPTPGPAPSASASAVPSSSERPVAPSPTPAVPAGGAAPTSEPQTR